MAKPGRVRLQLAKMLQALLGDEYEVLPEDLRRNSGATQYNDRSCWACRLHHPGTFYRRGRAVEEVYSYHTMSALVKHGKIEIIAQEVIKS